MARTKESRSGAPGPNATSTTDRRPASVPDDGAFEGVRRIYVLGVTLETVALLSVVLLIITFAVLVLIIDLDLSELERLGYPGLFVIAFIGAASIVLPVPGFAAVAGGGALLDPVAGIPAPVMVGLTAGLAEALGEFTGYAMGFGGTPIFERRRAYRLFYGWMTRYGMVAMFTLSAVPNPLFDLVGVAAGSVRMPVWKFFFSVLAGKTVKSMYVAGAGALIADLFF